MPWVIPHKTFRFVSSISKALALDYGACYGEPCERFGIHLDDARFFSCCHWLFARVRAVEVNRNFFMVENILLIVISLLLFGYLVYALLKPENF
jgi:K+-transporting ATPase KdpF subunit